MLSFVRNTTELSSVVRTDCCSAGVKSPRTMGSTFLRVSAIGSPSGTWRCDFPRESRLTSRTSAPRSSL